MGILDHFTCLLRNLYAGQEQQFELDMKQQTGSKLGKEYIKAVCCHPAYLTSIQSCCSVTQSCPTLCDFMDWSIPDSSVLHHHVSDAFQTSHPLLSPFPPAFNLSQHLCRVHHAKCQAGWITSWNQNCREKYKQPQICRWYHPNGRKWRGTKESLDEGKRGEEKADLKFSIQKTKIMASGPSLRGK